MKSKSNSFNTRLKILDEIYGRLSQGNKSENMASIRLERYMLFKTKYCELGNLVSAETYQDQVFFESEKRIFFEKHILILLDIKRENLHKNFDEILNYYKAVVQNKSFFLQGLGSLYEHLHHQERKQLTQEELGKGLFEAFKNLEELRISITKMMPAHSIAIEFNTQTNHLIDLLNQLHEMGQLRQVLESSRIVYEIKFQRILAIESFKEILKQKVTGFPFQHVLNLNN